MLPIIDLHAYTSVSRGVAIYEPRKQTSWNCSQLLHDTEVADILLQQDGAPPH
jgi:hypothetical protein